VFETKISLSATINLQYAVYTARLSLGGEWLSFDKAVDARQESQN